MTEAKDHLPRRDWQPDEDYPSSWLEMGEPERVDGGPGVTLAVDATNALGQVFRLSFTGIDEDVLLREINENKVSLVARPAEEPPAEDVGSLDLLVVDALAEVTGRSDRQLARDREALRASESPTLRKIGAAAGADLSVVIRTTLEAVRAHIEAILDEPEAPALADVPTQEDDALIEPGAVRISVEVIDSKLPDSPIDVDFYFDPPIHLTRPLTKRDYVSRVRNSVHVQLHARDGAMKLSLWVVNGHSIGSRRAKDKPASKSWPNALKAHGQGRYDINVVGEENGSNYHLFGTWRDVG